MKFQAIITDLDGTALDSPSVKRVSSRLAAAVQALEAQGIKVCAATGRAESFAMPVLESMELRQPAVISGGTRIIDPVSHQELWRCGLQADQLQAIVTELQDKAYGCLWNDYTEADYLSGGWLVTDFQAYDATYFFEVCFVPVAEVEELVDRLSTIKGITATVVVAQRSGAKDIHITNAVATKEHAIYELEKLIGVPKEQMIGIGDGHNDLHIFNAVGHKVAMGNAVEDLKSAADEIIGTVQQDGLAVYFEKLIKEASDEV